MALAAVLAVLLVPIGSAPAQAADASAARSAAAPLGTASASAPVGDAAASVRPATLEGFRAGNIISDATLLDSSTMTAAQIDAFLRSKVSSCQPGYTCLKDFHINSVNRPADAYCNGYTGAAGESAASIIYRVSQSCGINPQVFLVMLQKEQGLITHTWPSQWRYDSALGQGCPDDAACDPDFVGFFHQIYGAGRQLKIYMEGRYFQWYAPGNTWNIRYNPNIACGSAPVYVENAATASLYYYTPYQPNAAALAAGYGEGDGCSAYGNRNFYNYFTDWFGSTQGAANNPFGNLELVRAIPGKFEVSGWVIDPNTSDPLSVHVYVGAKSAAFTANLDRPDVGAAYPASGSKHGFTATMPADAPGNTNVCVYAINVGPGANVLMGCTTVAALTGSPVGALESATVSNGSLEIKGWALDPDTASPIAVHLYYDSSAGAYVADKERTDLPAEYAVFGTKHGFSATIPVGAGEHNVCAYGINVGSGANVELGCMKATAPVDTIQEKGRAPLGAIDTITVSGKTAQVKGWALDPDTAASIKVHIYVGGASAQYSADKPHDGVAQQYPAYGAAHGFDESVTIPAGTTTICVYGINTGPGGHALLGCQQVTAGSTLPELGRPPFGAFDAMSVSGNTATVSGWAIDPDTDAPIAVHLYVGSSSAAYRADKPRPDVAAAYPGYGEAHGFTEQLTVPNGTTPICAYAINSGPGGHTFLGCRNATVTAPVVDLGRVPFGNFEAAISDGSNILVGGWAIDPDTTDPISVHIYVDGASAAYRADKDRPDVAAFYPGMGVQHGISETIPATPGAHNVCIYAINNGAGGHALLGCRSVNVAVAAQ
ncbi:hypothetical protein GCM10025768_10360 [Microbacterium pseudoresistens]